jgi:hypothetical protein
MKTGVLAMSVFRTVSTVPSYDRNYGAYPDPGAIETTFGQLSNVFRKKGLVTPRTYG